MNLQIFISPNQLKIKIKMVTILGSKADLLVMWSTDVFVQVDLSDVFGDQLSRIKQDEPCNQFRKASWPSRGTCMTRVKHRANNQSKATYNSICEIATCNKHAVMQCTSHEWQLIALCLYSMTGKDGNGCHWASSVTSPTIHMSSIVSKTKEEKLIKH